MLKAIRHPDNPILSPNLANLWEAKAAFNGCPVFDGKKYHILYRALSSRQPYFEGHQLELSTVGIATGIDGIHYASKKQLVTPEFDWEKYGCEDPRVTFFEGKYYIFYTALSTFPFGPNGIKIGVAISKNLTSIQEKHQITMFNSKAMVLFPQRINGKIVTLFTLHTDMPPVYICMVECKNMSDLWSMDFWEAWYPEYLNNQLEIPIGDGEHIEVGAPPVLTSKGWLLIYSHIENYPSNNKIFGVRVVLLDKNDPKKIIGRTRQHILIPEAYYEQFGLIPNIVFPTGVLIKDDKLLIYYGACDTTTCVASLPLEDILKQCK